MIVQHLLNNVALNYLLDHLLQLDNVYYVLKQVCSLIMNCIGNIRSAYAVHKVYLCMYVCTYIRSLLMLTVHMYLHTCI